MTFPVGASAPTGSPGDVKQVKPQSGCHVNPARAPVLVPTHQQARTASHCRSPGFLAAALVSGAHSRLASRGPKSAATATADACDAGRALKTTALNYLHNMHGRLPWAYVCQTICVSAAAAPRQRHIAVHDASHRGVSYVRNCARLGAAPAAGPARQ